MDEGQIPVDDVFRQLSDSTPSAVASGSSSVFPPSNFVSGAPQPSSVPTLPASLPARQNSVNRQGLLGLPGRQALGNVNIFIDDSLRDSLENDNIFLDNAFQPQDSFGVGLPPVNSPSFGSNNQNFGSQQPAGQSVFISSEGSSAPNVNVGVPLSGLSSPGGPQTFKGNQNGFSRGSSVQFGLVDGPVKSTGVPTSGGSPVGSTGSSGVPLPILNKNAVNVDFVRSSAGSAKNFVTPVPVSFKPNVAHAQTTVNVNSLPVQHRVTQTPSLTFQQTTHATPKPTVINKSTFTTKPLPAISSSNTPSVSPFIDSFTSAPTSATAKPSPFASRDISSSLLTSLLSTLSNKITNPNQTFGSFLKSISGQNGVLVLPSSTLERSAGSSLGSGSSSPGSSFSIDFGFDTSGENEPNDFQLDLDSEESGPAQVTIVSSDANALSIGGSEVKSQGKADSAVISSTTVVETTTEPIAKVKTPVSLFRGPLSDILFTKGQWLGTLVGGLVDISRTVVGKIRESARKSTHNA